MFPTMLEASKVNDYVHKKLCLPTSYLVIYFALRP